MIVSTDALASGATRLSNAGIASARLDSRVLLSHILGKTPDQLIGRFEIDGSDLDRFESAIARRAAGEPIAYITGHKEFWSLDFDVGPGVLVPRPETETLIEQAMREFPDRSAPVAAIDFGTGSGCIPLSFLSEFPSGNATAVERSSEALAFARRNRAKFPFGSRLTLFEGDWAQAPLGPFDVAFTNPPYLAQHELNDAGPELRKEPQDALIAGADGLESYRVLAPLIAARMKPKGLAFLEIGVGQAEKVSAILAGAHLEILRIAPDLQGIPRCIVARPQKTVGMSGLSL